MKENISPKLTDRVDEDTMTIEELWENIAIFAQNRVEDNKLYDVEYPIETRKMQMISLKALVKAVEEFHEKFSKDIIL